MNICSVVASAGPGCRRASAHSGGLTAGGRPFTMCETFYDPTYASGACASKRVCATCQCWGSGCGCVSGGTTDCVGRGHANGGCMCKTRYSAGGALRTHEMMAAGLTQPHPGCTAAARISMRPIVGAVSAFGTRGATASPVMFGALYLSLMDHYAETE